MEHERIDPDRYELSYRRNHGVEVFLYWHSSINALTIALHDERGIINEFAIANDQGNSAFYHPYAYMPGEQPVGAK